MRLFYWALPFLLAGMQLSHADQQTTLDEVVVTARPVGLQGLEHTVQATTILDKEALAGLQSTTIGETVRYIPGVTTNRFSPFASRPIIRGFTGPRIMILENGINTFDVSTMSADHAVTTDSVHAKTSRNPKGPATLLYGGNAAGGLINVVNNSIIERKLEGTTAAFSSHFNTNSLEKMVTFELQGGHKNLALHFNGLHRDAGNYDSGDETIRNSHFDNQCASIGSSYIDDWGFVGLSYRKFRSTHAIPFNPEEPDELPFIETDQDRIDLSSLIKTQSIRGIETVRLRAGYSNYDHTEFEEIDGPGTFFDNNQWMGRLELRHTKIGPFYGVIGSEFGRKEFSAIGEESFIPPVDSNTLGFFFLEEIDWGAAHLELSGHYGHQQNKPNNGAEIDNDMYSISAGAHWQIYEDMVAKLSLSRTQRAPSIEELFANGPHHATGTFELGDTNLDVETINNIDVSLMKKQEKYDWELSLFFNYIKDYIFLQEWDRNNDGEADGVDESGAAAGELLLTQYRQDNARFYGAEFISHLNLYTGTHGILDFKLFGDYIRARRSNKENLPRIPPARIGIGLGYQQQRLKANIDWVSTLSQRSIATLEQETGSYGTLNMYVTYDQLIERHTLTLFLKGTNLTDKEGRLHTSFIKDRTPIMGRAFIVGFTAHF